MQEECNGTVLKAMSVTEVQLSHQLFPVLKIQPTGEREKKRLLRLDNYSLRLMEIISYSTVRHTFCLFLKYNGISFSILLTMIIYKDSESQVKEQNTAHTRPLPFPIFKHDLVFPQIHAGKKTKPTAMLNIH